MLRFYLVSLYWCLQLICFFNRNLRTAFREPLKPEGIYMVDPLADRTNFKKSMKPVKLMSVEGLKKALRFVIDSMDCFKCENICIFFHLT